MSMTAAEIRLKQNPILTNLLLGLGQGAYVAEQLFPRLPQALSSVTLARLGNERLRRYNLRRAPGTATKRVNIKYDGQVYSVEQYAVEVPLPRELLREADESRRPTRRERRSPTTATTTGRRSKRILTHEPS